ncbi:histone H4 [Striga asiatica]|uniref:Histone H4 n=1 Tax=Striga asiatica TaxID=4170 RepID=A0A5A7R5M6_STRAF|nr:histone H4 [Striga asiatica]
MLWGPIRNAVPEKWRQQLNGTIPFQNKLRDLKTTKTLAAKPVKRAALPLERIHHVHGGHRLPASMLRVGDGVTDDVLEEDLQDATSLLVDEAADALHAASTGKPPYRRLGDALDVIAKHFPMTLSAALSQALASLSPS